VASAPVASAPVAPAPVAPAQVASATEASELLESNSFLSAAINYAVKDLGYSEVISTDLLLQDPFRPPAVTTSGSIPNMGTSNPLGLSGSNSGLMPLQYATVLPGTRYQIQVNPDGSHQVVSSVQDMWGQSRGMTSTPDGSSSSGRLIHDIWNDKTIEDKADEGRANEGKADEGKADEGNANEDKADEDIADEGKADEGKADEGKADEGNFNEGKAGKGKTDDGRNVAVDEGTQMNKVGEIIVEPKEGN
jgi:hypothetical protein